MIISNFILILFILVNLTLVILFSKINLFHYNIDKPDKKRKFHSRPTPLAGGQIIFFNICIYWIINNTTNFFDNQEIFFENIRSFNYFMIASTSIFFLGFIDDRLNLKANLKFLILFLIILFLLLIDENLIINNIKFSFHEKNFFLDRFAIIFSIFCLLVFINAFNMFDGINLQSSSYSLIIFFSILFFYSNSLFIKILIISLIGFSYLNFKNKTFLGDSGSLLLSFIIGYIFIKFYNSNVIEYTDKIVIYMLIPGLDLIRLFIIRILNKKNPLSSDRNHLHHLLLKKFFFKKTLFLIILLVSFPILLDLLLINNIFNILITIIAYSLLITYTSKKY